MLEFFSHLFVPGPLLTYRLGGHVPPPPALLLAPPVGNFVPPSEVPLI
jgi:hypothetical protein